MGVEDVKYLYILVIEDGSACKVGMSTNPMQRARTLKQSFDYGKSIMISMPSGSVRVLERFLHILFKELSVLITEGDGHTEWFKIEAKEKVVSAVNLFSDELMTGRWENFEDVISNDGRNFLITLPIKMEEPVRDKFRALWLRLKSADFDVSQGETLEMAVDELSAKLDRKALETKVGH